ncbi:MAG: histidinol phosphate phosphatase domain-containing protein [Syntrophorhabdaceae bacterium]|nr:histidinol phosphate phosphatase domain-containing protein [Syntrophorhabdaceae bacterium]
MIDLHTHSFLSDGELIPAELIRRAKVKGYKVLGISDHVDHTNIDNIVRGIRKLKDFSVYHEGITVIPGVEITHVPPKLIGDIISYARGLGISYVVVHGETLSEPVAEGTNRAAIEAGADILAHPGLIKEEDALLAKEKGVLLEISTRKGHSLSNGHVAKIAIKTGANLILDTDSHSPLDLVTEEEALRIALGAGLTVEDFKNMQKNAAKLVEKIL